MSFEEPKPNFGYDQESNNDIEEITPDDQVELRKKPKEKRFPREFQKLFPSVLEDAELRDSTVVSESAYNDEIDHRKQAARQKINSKVENLDVKRSTQENRRYRDEFKEFLPEGTHETLSGHSDHPSEVDTAPQVIGSVLKKSGFASADPEPRVQSGKLKIGSAEPTIQTDPASQKTSSLMLAVQVGFGAALVAIIVLIIITF